MLIHELCSGSKNVTVVVRNSMAYSQTLRKKTLVVRAVVATHISKLPVWARMMEASGEAQGLQMPKLSVKQRQEKLSKELDLNGLESWPPELPDSAWSLLAEYHDVFALEPSELGCTHSNEHVIKVTDNTPLKINLGGFPCHWWKKSIHICEKCWVQVQSAPARVHGVTWWCWFERRMDVYAS